MNQRPYHIFTLDNGMRCVHWRTDGNVSYCGICVNAGSRDDYTGKEGLAHFLEHMLFKGTQHRRAYHISERMATIGGDINAGTSKESTLIYTKAPEGYLARSFDLISDIIINSNFPESEINKEREVIMEEIKSYLDSPEESVYDEFDDMLYAGSRVGHNILGTPDTLRQIEQQDFRRFLHEYYTPERITLYCADSTPSSKVEKIVDKYFSIMKRGDIQPQRQVPPVCETFHHHLSRDGHQAHTIMGMRTVNCTDSARFALMLLNNYLGGPGLNSRFNREIREKRGLVYTVYSDLLLASDRGQWEVYFGCDPDNVDACMRLVIRQLETMAESPIKASVFNRLKQQFAGMLLVHSDRKSSCAMSLAKSLMYHDKVIDIKDTADAIMSLESTDVQREAATLLQTGFSSLTLI